MRVKHFVRILLIATAMSAYSVWAWPDGKQAIMAKDFVGADDRIPLVHRAEAERLWQEPTTLFLDVRSELDFEVKHIEGAVSMPDKERLDALRPRLEQARTVVVYCKSIDCSKSLFAAIELRQAGLRRVVIYPEGLYDWTDAGLPTATGR